MSFVERYPQCATCPYLGDLQDRTDLHTEKLRVAESNTLDWELRAIEEDARAQVDSENLADVLDQIQRAEEAGELPEGVLEQRDELLRHFRSLNEGINGFKDIVKGRIAWHQEYATSINELLEGYELLATLLTDNCEGLPRTIHEIGAHACRSTEYPQDIEPTS